MDYERDEQVNKEFKMLAKQAQHEEEISRPSFLKELETLINKHSVENGSDTPDFLLAEYLGDCLTAYQKVVTKRDKWFGVDMWSENKLANKITENSA